VQPVHRSKARNTGKDDLVHNNFMAWDLGGGWGQDGG
jgi:hypothetical protein